MAKHTLLPVRGPHIEHQRDTSQPRCYGSTTTYSSRGTWSPVTHIRVMVILSVTNLPKSGTTISPEVYRNFMQSVTPNLLSFPQTSSFVAYRRAYKSSRDNPQMYTRNAVSENRYHVRSPGPGTSSFFPKLRVFLK